MASTSVCNAGAPLETKYAVVKSPTVHSVESSVLIIAAAFVVVNLLVDVLYPNGVFYVATLMATPGTVTDAQMIALARAQDAKYQANKASIG